MVYENGVLQYINTDYGRILYERDNSSPWLVIEHFIHEYHIKDHLGNTRAAFQVDEKDNYTITQDESYYPFGMQIEDLSFNALTLNKNLYLYNGKEMQEEMGLDWLDYGFRFYDPVLGRFPSIDPKADEFPHVSPFNYAENSPIYAIDLWGLQKFIVITLGSDVKYRGRELQNYTKGQVQHKNFPLNTKNKDIYSYIKTQSESDKNGIGFLAIFSHGNNSQAFAMGDQGDEVLNYDDLETGLKGVTFSEGSITYLGGCQNGKTLGNEQWNETTQNWDEDSFANKFSEVSGSEVYASDGKVAPKNEGNGKLEYQPIYPQEDDFIRFSNGNQEKVGKSIDVVRLFYQAKNQTDPVINSKRNEAIKLFGE